METVDRKNETLYQLTIIAAMLNGFGFPGSYLYIFGSAFGTLFEYGIFALEILVMLVSSGSSILDVRLLDVKRRYRSLYLFTGVVFVCSMWVTNSRNLQFITCFRLAVTILFAIWMSEHYSTRKIVSLACNAQSVFVVLTLGYTLMRPGVAFNALSGVTSFVGLLGTKNSAATELVFGICLFVIYFRMFNDERRSISLRDMGFLSLQLILIVLCRSTAAIITLVVMLIVLIPFTGKPGRQRRLPLGWVFFGCSLGFLFFALTILPLFSGLLEMLGKDATLTGRTPLWRQIIAVMEANQPFTGFGYGMFWRDPRAVSLVQSGFSKYSFMGSSVPGSHNLLLECWTNMGLLGTGALFLAMITATRKIRELSDDQYLFCAAVLLLLMSFGFTERVLSNSNSFQALFLFTALAVGCTREKKSEAPEAVPAPRRVRRNAED